MDYPTKESLKLGMLLVADNTRVGGGPIVQLEPTSPEMLEEAKQQQETFSDPKFINFVQSMHGHMHHSPLAQSCEFQNRLLWALMAKMFVAGWAAGRQEVMDAQVKQTLGESAS